MALSRKERQTLQELERQLADDPQLDSALATLPKGPGVWRRRIPIQLAWASVLAGALATIGLLTISFVLSFIGFLVLMGGLTLVAPMVVDTVRKLLSGGGPAQSDDTVTGR